jgi:hypothetical protein
MKRASRPRTDHQERHTAQDAATKPAKPADDPKRMTKSGRLDLQQIQNALKESDKAR